MTSTIVPLLHCTGTNNNNEKKNKDTWNGISFNGDNISNRLKLMWLVFVRVCVRMRACLWLCSSRCAYFPQNRLYNTHLVIFLAVMDCRQYRAYSQYSSQYSRYRAVQ